MAAEMPRSGLIGKCIFICKVLVSQNELRLIAQYE